MNSYLSMFGLASIIWFLKFFGFFLVEWFISFINNARYPLKVLLLLSIFEGRLGMVVGGSLMFGVLLLIVNQYLPVDLLTIDDTSNIILLFVFVFIIEIFVRVFVSTSVQREEK